MKAQRMPPQRFARSGVLAIDPRAFFELFAVPMSRANQRVGQVDVIDISGPLVQRDELWCDSYEAISARVAEACAGDAQAIVLRFDSPGGDASGCFETARAMREAAVAARKPLYAYVDKACSAAYALATAATHGIAIGSTCCAGSVGVMTDRADVTAANERAGVRYAFVTSGARKLDGNPNMPITSDELATAQAHCNGLASTFFDLIADMRPSLSAEVVASFDGGVFYGARAVEAGLADAVTTYAELLAIASKQEGMSMKAKTDYDVARAALAKVAKGSDANAKAAKAALATLAAAAGGDDDEPTASDETPPPADDSPTPDEPASEGDDDEPAAEADDDEPAAEADDDEPAAVAPPAASAPAATGNVAVDLAAQVHRMRAEMEAEKEKRARRALLAKRPDFAPELRAALAKAPLDTVREMVRTLPRGRVATPASKVATTERPPTRGGSTTGSGASAHSASASDMDLRMGLVEQRLGCRREGNALYFGVMSADKKGDAAASGARQGAK